MSSNYRTGTLYLYTLEPSENREPEKINTVEEKKYLFKYLEQHLK